MLSILAAVEFQEKYATKVFVCFLFFSPMSTPDLLSKLRDAVEHVLTGEIIAIECRPQFGHMLVMVK